MTKVAVVMADGCQECPHCKVVEPGGLWMPPYCICQLEDKPIRKLREIPDWCPLPDKSREVQT